MTRAVSALNPRSIRAQPARGKDLPALTVMTIDEPATGPIPLPRLTLTAHPVTIAAIAGLAERLSFAGAPAGEFGPVLSLAFTMITGGLAVIADPALPAGVWVLGADDRQLAQGTVIV